MRVTLPVRTFWEKAVILHQEANRENGKIPQRYSRHYYDLYKMYYSNVKNDALNNLGLLERTKLRNVDFENAKNMQLKIEKEIKNSNIPVISIEVKG